MPIRDYRAALRDPQNEAPNRPVTPGWSFGTQNFANGIADLYLYGVLVDDAWWDDEISLKMFKDEFEEVKSCHQINLHINSPGGNVYVGLAIYSLLLGSGKTIHMYNDGLCASAATIPAMAASRRFSSPAAMFMVHKPALGVRGNADTLRAAADYLDKVQSSLVETYAARVADSTEGINSLLNKETWLTGREAYAYGFITDLIEVPVAACYDASTKVLNIGGSALTMQGFKDFDQFYTSMEGDKTMADQTPATPITPAVPVATATQEPATPATPAATETPATTPETPETPAETPAEPAAEPAAENLLVTNLTRLEELANRLEAAGAPTNDVAALRAEVTALRDEVTAQKMSTEKTAVTNELKSFGGLGVAVTDEVINSAVSLKSAAPEAYNFMVQMLKAASTSNSTLLTTAGSGATPRNTGESFNAKVEAKIKATNCTYIEAVNAVAAEDPDLYENYRYSHHQSE